VNTNDMGDLSGPKVAPRPRGLVAKRHSVDTRTKDPLPSVGSFPWGWICRTCGSTCLRCFGSIEVWHAWVIAHRKCDGTRRRA